MHHGQASTHQPPAEKAAGLDGTGDFCAADGGGLLVCGASDAPLRLRTGEVPPVGGRPRPVGAGALCGDVLFAGGRRHHPR